MTAQQIYDLLHGHAGAFGDARVDRYRAEAGLRIRHMRGEKLALIRWIAENRARIEEDAVWAEARSRLLPMSAAAAGVRQMVKEALGTGEDKYVFAPGYDVSVSITDPWYGTAAIPITINIRTDNDKPVYFPWEPTPEQVAAGEREKRVWQSFLKSPQTTRLAKTKQVLSGIDMVFPVDREPFASGGYAAPPNITEAQYRDELARDKYGYLTKTFSGARKPEEEIRETALVQRLSRGTQGTENRESRVTVPVLESGEATFDLKFRHSPGKEPGYQDIVRTVPGVTLETLADTIYDMIGVGFPRSPYFRG
jgi:hypothetical protein